jgi:hypothetical protein
VDETHYTAENLDLNAQSQQEMTVPINLNVLATEPQKELMNNNITKYYSMTFHNNIQQYYTAAWSQLISSLH